MSPCAKERQSDSFETRVPVQTLVPQTILSYNVGCDNNTTPLTQALGGCSMCVNSVGLALAERGLTTICGCELSKEDEVMGSRWRAEGHLYRAW